LKFTNPTKQKSTRIETRGPTQGDGETILGDRWDLPYKIANMTAAWNLLYVQNETALAPNYTYCRFKPSTATEMVSLVDWAEANDAELTDTPIDYDIAYEGDHYNDPNVGPDEFTWEYTVVAEDRTLPAGIQVEIIDPLLIPPYESRLTYLAFVLSGNEDRYDAVEEGCHPADPNWPKCLDDPSLRYPPTGMDPCIEGCPNWPCCLLGETECEVGVCDIDLPCLPSDPNWPDCLYEGSGPPWSPPTIGSCGCPTSGYVRRPSGRIEVDDTQFTNHDGVRRVTVKGSKDGILWSKTSTDENGCWMMDNAYTKKFRLRVEFTDNVSDRLHVRSLRGARIWNVQIKPVRSMTYQFNRKQGDDLEDICILFDQSDDVHDRQQQTFVAAVANNSIHEYHDYIQSFGSLPDDMRILISDWSTLGNSAPMMHQLPGVQLINAAFGSAFLAGLALGPPAYFGTMAMEPDITYRWSITATDRMKDILYHEIAHAAHYDRVTTGYWEDYIDYIVEVDGDPNQPSPYGDGSLSGAGQVAVSESWAYAQGYTVTDMRYTTNHSLPGGATSERWINQLEGIRFIWGYIPMGLYHDLVDENGVAPVTGPEHAFVIDNYTGLSYQHILEALDYDIYSLDQYKARLWNEFANGVGTQADYDALFLSYNQ
jgi:hypothetical protein